MALELPHVLGMAKKKKKKIEGEKASELDMSPDLNFAFYRNDLGQVI